MLGTPGTLGMLERSGMLGRLGTSENTRILGTVGTLSNAGNFSNSLGTKEH